MYTIQSRNYEFKNLACGFRRIDLEAMFREENGGKLKDLIKQKERISYLYENGLSHVYISTRNSIFPELYVPPILQSRAGMKLFEIMQEIPLECKYFLDICAGPGAMSDLLLKSYDCVGVGITLSQDDISKQFYENLQRHQRYHISSHDDGDITRVEVISDTATICDAIFGKYNTDLVIADGAPNLSYDQENYQEIFAQKIILAEIITALECLKRHGKFILKIFDIFTKFTKCVVYVFSKLFNEVKIIKPKSSRITNSEKYLVGIDLMVMDEKRVDLLANLHMILFNFKDGYNCEEFVSIEKDSRFEQTFSITVSKTVDGQTASLCKILDRIDFNLFGVENETVVKKGKGKNKGKGKGKSKRAEPYTVDEKTPPPPVELPQPSREYNPFEEDCCFPED